ncbi:MAG: glycolate oxidase subunit GlcE [Gammaproteobacteria bacterium]|nr:glycolate oxidase subunit GlcE [Gammaproteobacteria bacterium]
MTRPFDDSQRLIDSVNHAVAHKKQLSILGHGTKAHYARSTHGDALQSRDHVGVIEYRPDELTISVRAGTSLTEIKDVLDEHDQMLACDPPRFFGGGTIGGAVASGLSGPGRPWYGNIRDAVLGIEIVNGLGECMRFGGSVMKNVAGFDVSRMMVGSLGIFGLILSVNLRVHPKPEIERTTKLELEWDQAWKVQGETISKPSAVSATCYWSGTLYLRLSGNRASVNETLGRYPESTETENELWEHVRDHNHPFFHRQEQLQRAWLGRGTQPEITNAGDQLVEWAGAQVWSHLGPTDSQALEDNDTSEPFDRTSANSETESKYVKRLRRAFDPHLLFNSDLRL